jgi:phage terminase large subunit-like protein
LDKFWQYISDVKSNKILTNKWVKLAIKRFEKDYKKSLEEKDYPFYFDEAAGDKVIKFLECLKLYKDQWAGKQLRLEPWQVFIVQNIYSWKRKDTNNRRFTKAFIFVARKNGKTALVSGLPIWDVLTTKGGEAYTAATKRDQAKIAYENIKEFIKQNEGLSQRLTVYKSSSRIIYDRTSSKIEALSADIDSMDGLNPSCVILDECSAMKNFGTVKVLQSGTYARPEPLLIQITSGGDNMQSVGRLEYERSAKVLEGSIEADDYFTILYCLDEKDDWRNEKVYIKANPNLGVSVSLDSLIKARDEAIQQPSLEGEFRVKNLNQWVSPMTAWISARNWSKCHQDSSEVKLNNAIVCGAVDLSKKYDFTAYSLYFYTPKERKYFARHHFYIPDKQVEDKMKTDSAMIRKWIEQGHITATPGEIIDYDTMYKDIRADLEKYQVREIAYDPYNAGTLIKEIGPLVDLVEFPQHMKTMSPAAKNWEADVMDGKIVDDNPVMKWMVSNAAIYKDVNENIKPKKDSTDPSSPKRIDGVITSIMAHARVKSYVDEGIDDRTPEEIEAEMTKLLAEIDY